MITDVVMPGTNGISLADSLSTEGLAPRVLMISGFHDQGLASNSDSPVRPFLAKPFKTTDLLNAVTSLLSTA
jgi:YesN/AraC family two-component response regulator